MVTIQSNEWNILGAYRQPGSATDAAVRGLAPCCHVCLDKKRQPRTPCACMRDANYNFLRLCDLNNLERPLKTGYSLGPACTIVTSASSNRITEGPFTRTSEQMCHKFIEGRGHLILDPCSPRSFPGSIKFSSSLYMMIVHFPAAIDASAALSNLSVEDVIGALQNIFLTSHIHNYRYANCYHFKLDTLVNNLVSFIILFCSHGNLGLLTAL